MGAQDAQAVLRRLRRIEGQARGVQRLVEERYPCQDILVQIEAMRSALQQVKVVLGGCHVQELIRTAFPDRTREAEELAQQVREALTRL